MPVIEFLAYLSICLDADRFYSQTPCKEITDGGSCLMKGMIVKFAVRIMSM